MQLESLVYQIYPSSFCSSKTSGAGDLAGITERLGYVSELGATHIWINPFYLSGGKDGGYDPIDHRAIDPVFGTIADLEKLIERASKLNIGVLVDLICGHVSDQHPWFLEACRDRNSPMRKHFIWRDERRNNWLSMFGGNNAMPAWTTHDATGEDYLHHFSPHQPTLNLRNPKVVEDILETVRFYSSLGVAGFRADAIDHLFHDELFRDNPAAADVTGENATSGFDTFTKPFNRQLHKYDIMQINPTLQFMRQIRRAAGENALLIAEVSSQRTPTTVSHRIAQYTRAGQFDSAYTLGLIRESRLAIPLFSQMHENLTAETPYNGIPGRMCWATQCHDEKRREHSAAAAEFYLYLSLILPGDKSVYYGEERGQQNNLSLADNDSYGRAPARGKIAWGSELERQQEDPDSFLNRYKRAIRFWRRNRAFLSDCTVELIETPSALRIVCYNNRRSMQFIFNESNQASERQVNDIPPFFKDSIMVLSGPSQALSLIKNLRLVIPPQSIVQLEGPAPPCAYERTA